MPTPSIQRRWKNLPGEPVGDAGDPYTGYDRFGRTEQMRWIKPHVGGNGFDTLANVQWGYDRASQKTWRKDLLAPASTGQDQHFGYDGLNQVTERQRGLLNINTTAVGGIPAQQENFSYDETGNWITYKQNNDGALGIDETRVNNKSNQMTQVDGSAAGISYDANGNMLTVPTEDGLTGPSRKLVWDAWNRLRKVSDADDNVIAEYEYDGLSRRTKVTSGGVTKHSYYDDQWRTVEERLDSSTTPVTQHVWHPTDRWELLFRDRSTANNGTLDERLYSLKDELDPVAICDASGNVVERFAYSAFGLPTFLNSSFIPHPSSFHSWSFLFHAEFADAETGWFNYGYRYYLAELGRWLSRDPVGYRAGINLYGFVGNGPTGTWDPLGLMDQVSYNYLQATGLKINWNELTNGELSALGSGRSVADTPSGNIGTLIPLWERMRSTNNPAAKCVKQAIDYHISKLPPADPPPIDIYFDLNVGFSYGFGGQLGAYFDGTIHPYAGWLLGSPGPSASLQVMTGTPGSVSKGWGSLSGGGAADGLSGSVSASGFGVGIGTKTWGIGRTYTLR